MPQQAEAPQPGSLQLPDLAMPSQAPQVPTAGLMKMGEAGRSGPMDPRYIDQVKKFEGFYAKPYWDYRQWTSGYGTRAQGPNERIDQATAETRLNDELSKARAIVEKTAPNAPEGVKAALTSLTFNAGAKWTKSGLGAAVQKGDYDTAQKIFTQYNKAGGQTLPGLATRRAEEAKWFNGSTTTPAQTASAPEPRTPIASNPQATGLVQLAQNGPVDAETFKRMMLNPNTRPLAQQMLQRELERRQPPTEDKILDRDYKRAQIKALEKKDGTHNAEVQGRYTMGQSMGLKGEDLTRYALTGTLPGKLNDPANDPDRVGQGIAGGLNSMARIPKEFGPTLGRAIGPVRGQESGVLPAIGKVIGSIHNMAGDRNTSEARARIAGDTEALAAQIKPLIRKPGEGTWSDADQARLNALVGNLATSRDVGEYKRNLEAVRQRLIDNFGVKLPPITWDDAPAKPTTPQGGGLPPGWSARRIN